MDEELIAAHGEEPKLMPYLHLPVQAGSDRMLKAMNRRHRAGDYLRLVERIRAARPDIALSGDFIVGFPGETEADFAETLALVEAVGYAQAYSFAYSARPGTPAAERAGVDEAEKAERLQRLQAVLNRQQAAFLAGQVGRVLPVLVEKPGREPGQMAGRSPYLDAVHFGGAGGGGRADRRGARSSRPGRTRWPGSWWPEGVIPACNTRAIPDSALNPNAIHPS